MRLLFVHDATFHYDELGQYYGTSVNNETLSRYRYLSDFVTVMIRAVPFEDGENRNRYTKISDDYRVIPIPNLMSLRGIFFKRQEVSRWLRQELCRYDAVVCRLSGLVGMTAAEICREQNIPYLVECVGNPWDALRYFGNKGKFAAPYFYWKTKQIIRRAPYVIYVTKEYLQKIFPTKGAWVACSNVTLPKQDARIFEKRLEHLRWGHQGPVIMGSAGKIDLRYKGYEWVIRSIRMLNEAGIRVRYELAGDGDPSALLTAMKEEGVEDQVHLVGVLSHEQVLSWMDGLDLYLQPSETEGLPRALIEAMSRGCPCVGSDAGGIPELLPASCIFEKKNASQFVERVQWVLENKEACSAECYHRASDYERETIENRRNRFFDRFLRETQGWEKSS